MGIAARCRPLVNVTDKLYVCISGSDAPKGGHMARVPISLSIEKHNSNE